MNRHCGCLSVGAGKKKTSKTNHGTQCQASDATGRHFFFQWTILFHNTYLPFVASSTAASLVSFAAQPLWPSRDLQRSTKCRKNAVESGPNVGIGWLPRILSGWNWTPKIGSVLCSIASMIPSSDLAVTRISGPAETVRSR